MIPRRDPAELAAIVELIEQDYEAKLPPKGTWETLAVREYIPMSWLDMPDRKFQGEGYHGAIPYDERDLRAFLTIPPQVVATIEELARMVRDRVSQWWYEKTNRLLWRRVEFDYKPTNWEGRVHVPKGWPYHIHSKRARDTSWDITKHRVEQAMGVGREPSQREIMEVWYRTHAAIWPPRSKYKNPYAPYAELLKQGVIIGGFYKDYTTVLYPPEGSWRPSSS